MGDPVRLEVCLTALIKVLDLEQQAPLAAAEAALQQLLQAILEPGTVQEALAAAEITLPDNTSEAAAVLGLIYALSSQAHHPRILIA